jgi:integrase
MLRFSNLINDNCTFRDSFPVFEKKTRNTRSRKKNRYITINNAVIESVTLYLEHTPNVCMSDYMFRSVSNNGGNLNEPLSVKSIDRILKGIADELDLSVKMSTHTLRKTFCYWMMVRGHNDSRRLLLLQKMLGHSSPAQTLDYIGLTGEEIEDAYRHLNLGSAGFKFIDGNYIQELEAV